MPLVVRGEVDSGNPRSGDPGGRGRDKGTEGFGGHYEGIAKHADVCAVANFFGEDVA